MNASKPIEDKIYRLDCSIKRKQLRLAHEKRRLAEAKKQRAQVESVHMELSHRDFRLEPALRLYDQKIREIIESTDCLANEIRELNYTIINLGDLVAN